VGFALSNPRLCVLRVNPCVTALRITPSRTYSSGDRRDLWGFALSNNGLCVLGVNSCVTVLRISPHARTHREAAEICGLSLFRIIGSACSA